MFLTLLIVFGIVAIVTMLLRINASNASFRSEVEKGLLTNEMGRAVRQESQIIGAWTAIGTDNGNESTDMITPSSSELETLLTAPGKQFNIAAEALLLLMDPEEQPTLDAATTAHAGLLDSARELDRLHARSLEVMSTYRGTMQPLEQELRSAIGLLRMESSQRVAILINDASNAETSIRIVLPILAVAALGSTLALSMLKSARRKSDVLQDLVSAKDEFIASVSHELRTPLTGVVGFAVELEDWVKKQADPEAAELMAIIVDEAQQAAYLVEDLLVAARFEIDTVEIRCENIELRSLVEKVVGESVLRRSPPMQAMDIGSSRVVAYADPKRIRQILRNLFTNAVHYGGEEIAVKLYESATTATLQVIDNGPGVPVARQERIFDAYVNSPTGSQHPESVGLGLAVARRLARLMDGDLTYHYAQNRSVFELVLPIGRFGPVTSETTASRAPTTV